MTEHQTRQEGHSADLPERTLSADGRPEVAQQAEAELPQLEAEEERLRQEVERLRAELGAAESAHEHVKTAVMSARRAAITGEPQGPREGELLA